MNSAKTIRSGRRRYSKPVMGIAVVAALGLVAACSSSSKSTPASTGSSGGSQAASSPAAGVPQKVKDNVAAHSKNPDIGLAPLSKKPATGKSAIYLTISSQPSDLANGAAAVEAAKAVGWTGSTISYDGTPVGLGKAMDQAIAQKPTAIMLTSQDPSLFRTQLAEADKDGIAVVDSNITSPATGPADGGLAGVAFGAGWGDATARLAADWAINDSNGHAHVLIANVVTGFPGNLAQEASYADELKTECADCSSKVVNIELTDIGGKGPSLEVAALNSDPSLNYVWFGFGAVGLGFDAALKAAGLSGKVKITSGFPLDATFPALLNGTEAMTSLISQQTWGWTVFDAVLRYEDTGQPANTNYNPSEFFTKDNTPATGTPIAPSDYQEQFKKAWLVD